MAFLRVIAVWSGIVSVGVSLFLVHGVQLILRGASYQPVWRTGLVLLLLFLVMALGFITAVQLWRGKRMGRVAGIMFFTLMVLFGAASFVLRRGSGAITPAVIAFVALATLVSPPARELTSK